MSVNLLALCILCRSMCFHCWEKKKMCLATSYCYRRVSPRPRKEGPAGFPCCRGSVPMMGASFLLFLACP